MIEHTMVHLNYNLLVSVYVETTGDNPKLHDITEICVILLDNFCRPSTKLVPFYTSIQPLRPENIDYETSSATKAEIQNASQQGLMPSVAADRFEDWIRELDLPQGKRIVPIVHDWRHVGGFLESWLGVHTFKHLVSNEARDLQSMALYLNDCKNVRAKPILYPKVLLHFIANLNHITLHKSMDIMEKAVRQAEIYRLMLGNSNN